jgi:adenine-specific DNA methylase
MVVDVPPPKSSRQYIIMEEVCRSLGRGLPFHRDWVTGPDSLVDVYRRAGLEVVRNWESDNYVEERMLEKGKAGEVFEGIAETYVWRWLGEDGGEERDAVLRDEARKRFVRLFEEVSDEEEGGRG